MLIITVCVCVCVCVYVCRELGGVKGRVDHSVFAPQCSEMTHSIKLVDRTLHWDDQGIEVPQGRYPRRACDNN